jgi:hypothetical protein
MVSYFFALTLIAILASRGIWFLVTRRARSFFVLRRAGEMPTAALLGQSARGFASQVALSRRGFSLVSAYDGRSLSSLVVGPPDCEKAARNIADAVAGNLESADVIPLRSERFVKMRVHGISGDQSARDASATALAESVASGQSAQWVGVSVRQAWGFESVRWENRKAAQVASGKLKTQTADSDQGREADVLVGTVYAGAATVKEAKAAASGAAKALPGYNSKVSFTEISQTRTAVILAIFGALVTVAGAKFNQPGHLLGVPLVTFALAVALRFMPTEEVRLRAAAARGTLPWAVPMFNSAALLAPNLAVQFAAPHAGAASGSSTVDLSRKVDPQLLEGDYLFGEADARFTFLDDEDRFEGVGAVGTTGGGKSGFLRLILGGDLLHRRKRPTLESVIIFEGQADSVRDVIAWCERTQSNYHLIEFATGGPWAIDHFRQGSGAPLKERVGEIVAAYSSILAEGEMYTHGRDVLTAMFTLGMAVTPEIATAARVKWSTPMRYASALVGNIEMDLAFDDDDDFGSIDKRLAAELKRWYTDNRTVDSAEVVKAHHNMFEVWTDAKRPDKVGPTKAKITRLLDAPDWWSAPVQVDWDTILKSSPVVIVNFGTSVITGAKLPEDVANDVAAITLAQLQWAIERVCGGWFSAEARATDTHRIISVYLDELAVFCRSNGSFFVWAKQQARKYGLRLCVATQDISILPDDVRTTLKNFGAMAWFKQHGDDAAQLAATDLGKGWEAEMIKALPKFTAAVRYSSARANRTDTIVKVPWFEGSSDASAFMAATASGQR